MEHISFFALFILGLSIFAVLFFGWLLWRYLINSSVLDPEE